MFTFLFFVLLIQGSSPLGAMEAQRGDNIEQSLETIEKTMKAKIKKHGSVNQAVFRLQEMQARLFDEALLVNDKNSVVTLLSEAKVTIGYDGMERTQDCFNKASEATQLEATVTIANIDYQKENRKRLLWILASLGKADLIKKFFNGWTREKCQKYIDLPWRHYAPLSEAAFKGHRETVNVLASFGAQLDCYPDFYNGFAPLYRAALGGNELIAHDLIRLGADKNLHPEGT